MSIWGKNNAHALAACHMWEVLSLLIKGKAAMPPAHHSSLPREAMNGGKHCLLCKRPLKVGMVVAENSSNPM